MFFLGPTRIIIICIEIISSWTGTILVVARNTIIIVDSNVCNESSFSKESLWFVYLICVFFLNDVSSKSSDSVMNVRGKESLLLKFRNILNMISSQQLLSQEL